MVHILDVGGSQKYPIKSKRQVMTINSNSFLRCSKLKPFKESLLLTFMQLNTDKLQMKLP